MFAPCEAVPVLTPKRIFGEVLARRDRRQWDRCVFHCLLFDDTKVIPLPIQTKYFANYFFKIITFRQVAQKTRRTVTEKRQAGVSLTNEKNAKKCRQAN